MRCTRTTSEKRLGIQGPQSQSRRTGGKINSIKVRHQEESENTTPFKPKGTTKKDSCNELYDKDGCPIVYCHNHGIIYNLTHGSMNFKFPSNTHKKEATFFNQMVGCDVTNKPKPNKLQVGSGRDTHLINNSNSYITQSTPCDNQNTPSGTHQ